MGKIKENHFFQIEEKKLMYIKNGKYNVFDNPAQKQMKIYPFPRNLFFLRSLTP